MLVVMHRDATAEQIERVVEVIRSKGLTPHPLPGATRTAIGITGNVGAVDPHPLALLPGVCELIRVTKAYKLTSREMHPEDTVVQTPQATIGPKTFTVIAGPCSVETEEMILRTAEALAQRGIKLMRAGAFKPRTSPYAFQGLGEPALKMLAKARARTGIGIVTELLEAEHAEAVAEVADIIQIGARNMQNYGLLRRVGQLRKPVLLKRGLSATLEELLLAGEYVLSGGNFQLALCERGVRTFADHTRNTLDLSIVPSVKKASHLPILVDPSHGTGRADYVPPMALASLAAGADGLLIEVHPEPERALSDGMQSLNLKQFDALLDKLRRLAPIVEREII
jgi:3-deoxy-7-phosphoheptulonate synthase